MEVNTKAPDQVELTIRGTAEELAELANALASKRKTRKQYAAMKAFGEMLMAKTTAAGRG